MNVRQISALIVVGICFGASLQRCQADANSKPAGGGQDLTSRSRAAVKINVNKTKEPISKYIYGQFIEHLGRCIYGGIWAEMLEDRKFYYPVGSPPTAGGILSRPSAWSPWKVIGSEDDVTMSRENPYVGEHTPLIQPGGGIRQLDLGLVKNKRYVGYILFKPQQQSTNVIVSLLWGDKPGEQDSTRIMVVANRYGKYPFKFKAGADTEKGKLEIKVAEIAMGACFAGVVSLMPADNVNGLRADTLKLLKELNSPIYRWPGGNFVSGYDWRDGIGERDKRPPRKNAAWKGIEHNDFGLDEFIMFCREVGAEPMIAVNSGFGDDHSAAQEVEYANGSIDTLMGRWRAANGHREPYNVKWWCIGNEMYGKWQLGHMDLKHYVRKHNLFAKAMRKVDPSIKLVAVGSAGPWSEGMLESCADYMDLISEHFYKRAKESVIEHARQIPDAVRGKVAAHRDYRKRLEPLKGKDIRIAIDEWNYWYGTHLFGELGTRYFLRDALGIAAGLHEMIRNSDIIFMANYAQTVNVIGAIKTTKTAAAFETTGLVLNLYRNHFGQVPVTVTGDTDALDVVAALTADRKALTVGIVNPTQHECEVTLDLKGAQPAGGRLWLIASFENDPMAYNEPGKDPNVRITEKTIDRVLSELEAPPFSVSLYMLDLHNPQEKREAK